MTGNFILDAVIILSTIGIVAAIVLYFVSKAFKVIEDPRIDEVVEVLPGANCGGCGYAGCRNFAEEIVKAGNMDGLACPAGGNSVAALIAPIIGIEVTQSEPKIAVIRCNGTSENAPAKVYYDSALSCVFANSLYAGENACTYGCLGCGDCVKVCQFDAIYLDRMSNLPVVIDHKCVACGACMKACPRSIIEIRNKGKKERRIYVSCMNKEKGVYAKKNCEVACIGCGKCVKICPFEAIMLENNLAYIDDKKCKLCRKCASECPTHAIREINFQIKEAKKEELMENR